MFFCSAIRAHVSKKHIIPASILVSSLIGKTSNCDNTKISKSELHIDVSESVNVKHQTNQVLYNWSGTHCSQYDPNSNGFVMWEPSNEDEIFRVLSHYWRLNVNGTTQTTSGKETGAIVFPQNTKCRPLGSSLSPNGIGMPHRLGDALTLAHFQPNSLSNKTMQIDLERRLITVSAGCTVSEVLEELKKANLTIENFSSITEQQVGGWMQVAAHGTGNSLTSVDNMITGLCLATYYPADLEKGQYVPCTIQFDTLQDGNISCSVMDSKNKPLSVNKLFHAFRKQKGRSSSSERRNNVQRDPIVETGSLSNPPNASGTPTQDEIKQLFGLCRVNLGGLGVVTQMTLKCIPLLTLTERTLRYPISNFLGEGGNVRLRGSSGHTLTNANVMKQRALKEHYERLSSFRHLRYMWLPYTDSLICVQSNPTVDDGDPSGVSPPAEVPTTEAMRQLLAQVNPEQFVYEPETKWHSKPDADIVAGSTKLAPCVGKTPVNVSKESYSVAQLRDMLLDVSRSKHSTGPDFNITPTPPLLDTNYVQRINRAEEKYWKSCHNQVRTALSNDILKFDCGGQQLVYEICFPIGSSKPDGSHSGKDIEFVLKLLNLIEKYQIPAPCPIEQRWGAANTISQLSPCYSTNADDKFSYVGVIMYLPPNATGSEKDRARVIAKFQEYIQSCLSPLLIEYNAVPHWAKIETSTQLQQQVNYYSCLEQNSNLNADSAETVCKQARYDYMVCNANSSKNFNNGDSNQPIINKFGNIQLGEIKKRFGTDLDLFVNWSQVLDPHGIFKNEVLNEIFELDSAK